MVEYGEMMDGMRRGAQKAESCPPATQSIELNLENRQNALDTKEYGPANPQLDESGMKECIAIGIGDEGDPELAVDAGELGYCQALDFKCASMRVCIVWAGRVSD